MAYCCVPHCCSDSKKKLEGVSFHEIPADLELREAWIKVIRRDKWTPCTTSNYSRVCSQHFKEADFLEGKRRRLRKGAVPSVFQHYPLHLQPKNETPSDASIRKRSLSSDAQKGGLPRKMQNRTRNEEPPHAPTPSSSDLHETGHKSTLQSTADLTDHGLVKNTEPLCAPALGSLLQVKQRTSWLPHTQLTSLGSGHQEVQSLYIHQHMAVLLESRPRTSQLHWVQLTLLRMDPHLTLERQPCQRIKSNSLRSP